MLCSEDVLSRTLFSCSYILHMLHEIDADGVVQTKIPRHHLRRLLFSSFCSTLVQLVETAVAATVAGVRCGGWDPSVAQTAAMRVGYKLAAG